MTRDRVTQGFILGLVCLMAAAAAGAGSWTPATETARGTALPRQASGEGPPGLMANGGLLYLTSSDTGSSSFAVYDPATNSWMVLNPYQTGCEMAVSAAGDLYGFGYATGTIDLYDPVTDTWSPVMAAPAGATGAACNLKITTAGEFLYVQGDATTLWYTAGGVWNTLALPFTTNMMADYDPTTHQCVIGQRSSTNAHLIDLTTWAITDFTSSLGNGEWARNSVILGGRYYFESNGNSYHSFDLGNPALPPFDHGWSVGWYSSAAADRGAGAIYIADIDGIGLRRFDPAANTLTPLANSPLSIWHSLVAFTGVAGSSAVVTVNVGPGGGGTVAGGGVYPIGAEATVTATPDPGWVFLHWLVNSTEITDNPYTFTVAGNITLTAVFARQAADPIPVTGTLGLVLLLGTLLGVGAYVLRRMG